MKKNQALFSSKDKVKKKLKCRLLQFLLSALRVKAFIQWCFGLLFLSLHRKRKADHSFVDCGKRAFVTYLSIIKQFR